MLTAKPQMELVKYQEVDSTLCFWRDDYLKSKRVKLEATTIRNYQHTIDLYIQYVGETHWPPTRFDVIQFLDDVQTRSSQITAFSYWSILRAWFNFMDKLGVFDRTSNPADQISRLGLAPRRPKTSPKGIPKKDIDILFAYLRSLPSTVTTIRDLSLVHLLYRTGMRSGEATNLSFSSLCIRSNRIFILASQVKDDKDRTVFFGEKVKSDLEEWLQQLAELEYTGKWVFPSLSGWKQPLDRPITPSGANQMFHERLAQAGLSMYRVHDLRHSFTKEAMRKGKSLTSIQRQLGHASPDMVLRYAQVFSLEQEQEFINFGDDE